MLYLFLVSLLWAFSFGLIKGELTGLPPGFIAFVRLAIACAVFLPFLRIKKLTEAQTVRLLLTGAVQYGLMYITYIRSYQFLQAYEVALFTVLTPIYVTLIHDLFERRVNPRALGAVVLAVAGGAVIKYQQINSPALWKGFLLMQVANLCFAFGQIFYRRTMDRIPNKPTDAQVFALLYMGAAFTAGLTAIGTNLDAISFSHKQIVTLLYLGAVASGLGFFLWNIGARRTRTGTLAIFNNLKIPLGIIVSILVFKESADGLRLACGGCLMVAALAINAKKSEKTRS